ncbi:hypothetical protein C6I20_04350 [Aeromicrobium sp. A1-2]|uniref:HTTM domain-containing protein n=1 Tax=Aeromicrobium sp. A1-2 TaxID=2107713 RepID=UPI000E47F1FF|nr:HTTM domain-containing protein [Aeromicrobium sp. A1-2]AXT84500.1 hypothetical protein C6I20_04350 [Aeromicrobium sp. A1-2]
MVQDIWWRLRDASTHLRDRFDVWALGGKHALRGAAACRLGIGLSVLGLLLSNFSRRDMWIGQGSVWAEPARAASRFPELALLRNVSGDVLTVVYVATVLAALALVLGWHTKAANVLTFLGFIAIVGQNPVVGTQGDNLIRLTLLWMLLMRTGEYWSLDARRHSALAAGTRAARRAEDDVLPPWLSTGMHNVGLFGLGAQTILVFMSGGLDKVAQPVWQHGTALYYTMQLPESRPFPWLSDLLSSSSLVLAVLTYAVLMVQLFFGPLLLHPLSRRLVLGLSIALSVMFAVVFAAPWSSLATIAVTGLFVSSGTWARVDVLVRQAAGPAGDWLVLRWYDLLDLLDAGRHRFVFPAVDWVRITVFRR